jgi:hypothetical protein
VFMVSVVSDFPKHTTPEAMLASFIEEDLPLKQPYSDVENLYKNWSIEQPSTKQLMHKITVELMPFESKTIVIVLKSPTLAR